VQLHDIVLSKNCPESLDIAELFIHTGEFVLGYHSYQQNKVISN